MVGFYWSQGRGGGRQFRRCGCAFTWAFGRVVASSTRVVFLGLRPRLVYVGPLALGVGSVDGVCEHVMG